VNLSLGKKNPHEETETDPIAEAYLQRSVRRLPGPDAFRLINRCDADGLGSDFDLVLA